MGKIHRQYSPSFKVKRALETIKEEKTVTELISRIKRNPKILIKERCSKRCVVRLVRLGELLRLLKDQRLDDVCFARKSCTFGALIW